MMSSSLLLTMRENKSVHSLRFDTEQTAFGLTRLSRIGRKR